MPVFLALSIIASACWLLHIPRWQFTESQLIHSKSTSAYSTTAFKCSEIHELFVYNYFCSQNSSVSIVARQWAVQTRKGVLISSRGMTSSLLRSNQRGSKIHPASCSMGGDGSFCKGKVVGARN